MSRSFCTIFVYRRHTRTRKAFTMLTTMPDEFRLKKVSRRR